MRTFMMLAALLVSAIPLAAQDPGGVAAPGASRVDETRPFAPDANLRVMIMEGSVRILTWDRDSVRVAGRLDAAGRRGFYFAASRAAGGKLGVEPNGGGRADLEVTVPVGARLWVKTAGAPITVAGVNGSLDLYSVTGELRIDGDPRSLYAESMAGSITLTGDPHVARLRTGAGDITVRGGGPDLSLTSVNGAIAVTGTTPLRRVLVETVSGAVGVDAALAPSSSVSVTSHDGAVDIAVPDGTDAEFLVMTLDGELRNRLTGGGARKATGLRGRELSFTSGTGEAEVTVRTFSGSITVRTRDGG